MYKVYLDDTLILDPSRNSNDYLIEDPKVELADNSAGSFSFTIYPNNPGYDLIEAFSVVSVYQDDELIFKGRIISHGKDDLSKSAECEGELAYLADSIQAPHEYHDQTVRGYLETLIDYHNEQVEDDKRFEVGAVTVRDSNDSLYRYTNDEDTLSVIKDDLIDSLGGHLRIRYDNGKRYLDYLEDYPRVSLQTIEFGKNLLSYAENTSAFDLATRVIPLGASLDESSITALNERLSIADVNNGKRYIELPEAIRNYGYITKVVTFDDVHVADNLKKKGQAWLSDNQFETLELNLSAVDLGDFGIESDHLRLLDRIRCTSKPHGMDREFPLTGLTIYLLEPERNVYKLGSKEKTFTASTSRAQKSYQDYQRDTPTSNALWAQAKKNAEALLNAFAHSGYVYITENEIYILDIPCESEDDLAKAKNVWRWNMGGLAFSKSGYKGPYEAAMTMDGTIMGNLLAAGTVAADKIDVGYTQAQEKKWQDELGNNYWTSTVTQSQIKNSASSIELSVKEWAGTQYYTKSQIDVKTDSINLEVEKKVGANEIISKINLSPESIKISSSKFNVDVDEIRLQANKTIAWKATNSSMTENGTLSCSNAEVKGTFRCGSESGQWVFLNSSGQMTGGNSSTQYGYVDFSATAYNVDNPAITYRGLQIQGEMLRISTSIITVSNSTSTSVTTTQGFTGQCRVTHNMASDMSSCSTGTLGFINGICVVCPTS